MMIGMILIVPLFAILLVLASAIAFREAPRDIRDVFCFLAMLVVCVAVVLVFVLEGF